MAITYVATGTVATTFTEQPARRLINRFGEVEVLFAIFRGLEANYNTWAPSLGSSPQNILSSPTNTFSNFFLVQIDKQDAEGGLIDVTLTYIGGESVSRSSGGVIYSNLKVNVELLSKSFSWSGAAKIGTSSAILENVTFNAQYGTLECNFRYTAYQYANGGQFRAQAVNLVGIPTGPFLYSTGQILILTGATNFIIIPQPILPQLVLSRFTAQQNSTTTFLNSFPNVVTQPSVWDVQETWSLEYNMGSLGVATSNYSFS